MNSAIAIHVNEHPPEYAYHVLRSAYALYDRAPSALEDEQIDTVQRQAHDTFRIESLVLGTPEASEVDLPQQQIDEALAHIAARYADRRAFRSDMHANGLDEATLRAAVHRELLFDAVMNRVAERGSAVCDVDVQLFYQLHRQRFVESERRTARHILITINPGYPDNTPESSQARIVQIERRLRRNPKRFSAEATRHSECPTAMQGGLLGEVTRGKLYAELDAALFGLREGGISGVVETELGLHLVLCERIRAARIVPFEQAAVRIRSLLEARQRKTCQKAWLAGLGWDR